ncbi:MAG: cysteine methyltransferase [Pseudonocardiales bacterium]|nr:cysteine methyltransferase [Pseudonocardiales bacterium]
MTTRHVLIETVLGPLTLVADGDALIGVYFPHHWTKPSAEDFGPETDLTADALLSTARDQLTEYLDGTRTTFDLPTAATGDPFQQKVWALLAEIPRGQTISYGELAEHLGDKHLAQAVGQAVGQNPLSIIVP